MGFVHKDASLSPEGGVMAALAFVGRPRVTGKPLQPVHVLDPDRGGDFTMCGADAQGMAPQLDPIVARALRACLTCERMRDLARERAERRGGIRGGWEDCSATMLRNGPDGVTVELPAWGAVDTLGNRWYVYAGPGRGCVAAVVRAGTLTPMLWVRKVGSARRAHWPSEAKAMAGCEALARNGDYVLDRPRAAIVKER